MANRNKASTLSKETIKYYSFISFIIFGIVYNSYTVIFCAVYYATRMRSDNHLSVLHCARCDRFDPHTEQKNV